MLTARVMSSLIHKITHSIHWPVIGAFIQAQFMRVVVDVESKVSVHCLVIDWNSLQADTYKHTHTHM